MAADILIQALGLNTSPNSLAVPQGSLLQATNVIIQRDNVVEPRRGFKLYGTAMPSPDDRASQLLTYKGRILRHIYDFMQFDTGEVNLDGEAIFETFTRELVRTGDTTNLSPTITNINTELLSVGMSVTGTGIPASTTISEVGGNTLTLSNDATATASDVSLTFAGSELITEVIPGRRLRSVESNGNTYITSAQGIRKLSAVSASGISAGPNFITTAGGLKAIGIEATLDVILGSVSGFLPQDSAVAYRAVWGNEDANKNLILGTPSERSVVYNSLLGLIIQDFMSILLAVDNVAANPGGGAIDDYGYVEADKVTYSDSATTVRQQIIDFASRLDADIYAALPTINDLTWSGGIATIKFTSNPGLVAGDFILIESVAPSPFNGTYDVQTVTNAGPNYFVTYNLPNDPGTYTPSTGTVRQVKYLSIAQPAEPGLLPTNQQLVDLQTYLSTILTFLQAESAGNITPSNLSEYITPIFITTTAQTMVRIDIPPNITSDHFMQLYRSDIVQATAQTVLSDLTPNDEQKQVYEAFPTSAELAQGFMIVEDNVPDAFRGANLYTNPSTGEGILQANDLPPVATDVAQFQNTIFYANTSTRERLFLNMLGTTTLLAGNITSTSMANPTVVTTDAPHGLETGDIVYINDTGSTPPLSGLYKATVTGATTFTVPVTVTVAGTGGYWTNSMVALVSDTSYNLYKFIKGRSEVTTVTTVADVADSLNGTYFFISSPSTDYAVFYKTSGGILTEPAIAGRTNIRVDILTGGSAADNADRTRDAMNAQVVDFVASASTNVVTITNVNQGIAADATAETSGFTIATTTQGRGEDASNQEVLLSTVTSPATALDQTSRSFVDVVNANPTEVVSAYYLSGVTDVPGKMLLEGRNLSSPRIYAVASSPEVGNSFDPIITPTSTDMISNSVANPTVVTTASPHGLVSGDEVVIAFSDSTPPISGIYTVTFLSPTTFSVPVNVSVAGTTGLYEKLSRAVASDNEVKPNRLYYSKFQQPEAVPIVNYFDVGAGDKAILRIFPIRTSLFIFKEDGLFRVSGDSSPFALELFDQSVILRAADSLDVGNNQLYGWTMQGIQVVNESGADPVPVSRPIDVDILKLASSNFPNFASLTWGVGYNSDNSYTVYTNTSSEDTAATIGYRYSFLTTSWTIIDKTASCGVINPVDDRMYLGSGNLNYTEQERKTFTRTDYADREFSVELLANNYFVDNRSIKLTDVSDYKAGDVLVQVQPVSVYTFNALLAKLDADPGVGKIEVTSISTGANPLVTTVLGDKSLGHNLAVGDYVTLTSTNCTPLLDGTFQVLTVPSPTTFTVSPEEAITASGTEGFAKLNYAQTITLEAGGSLREQLVELADKLDTDPGTDFTNYATLIDNISGSITAISATNPTEITSVGHGLVDGRIVSITGTNSTPTINSTYTTTLIDSNTFSVPVSVVISGTAGSYQTETADPYDQLACFNAIVDNLNDDSGVAYSNYTHASSPTTVETIITAVNVFTDQITLTDSLTYVQGEMTIYESIPTLMSYAPLTMNDPWGFKHMREATMMFANKAFSAAKLNFASDLQPRFIEQPFVGMGPGLFGSGDFGSDYFGGGANSAPFRTYVPRPCQRCRYLLIQFQHQVAREKYGIYGITLTGEPGLSSRAYR